jgi:redox-sensitive bicupin YhaK (pirin superfamily)
MTAGRGIVHSEMPKQKEGKMHGFQMWVNLPAKDKMCEPRYQDFQADQIPVVTLEDGVKVKIMAGEFQGKKGAGNLLILLIHCPSVSICGSLLTLS